MILPMLGYLAMMSSAQTPDPRPISAEAQKAISANLGQFKGIVGDWEGTGLGGEYDEHWLPAKGNSMMGLFRLTAEGKLLSASALNLVQEGEHVHMILRGLGPDLAGDAKPTVMVLVERTDEMARFVNKFEGVLPKTLTVTHPDGGLRVVVESLNKGEPTKTELNFKRASQPR